MTRFDAAADRQLRTSDLLSMNSDYTIMGWAYLSSDTNTYQTFYGVSDDSTNNFDTCGASADGTTFMVGRTNGGAGTFVENTGTVLSLNTWYHWCVVRSGSNLTGYLNGVQDVTISSSISGRAAATRMELGGATSANLSRLDGRENYIKAWAAALTLAEINIERPLIRPTRLANLYGWWPLLAGSAERLRDYSGFGRAWTEVGTLTDEDQPPVAWGGSIYVIAPNFSVAITPNPVSAAASKIDPTVVLGSLSLSPNPAASSAAVVDPTTVLGSVAITPSPVSAASNVIAPTVVLGNVVITPASADSVTAVVTPDAVLGSLTIALDPVQAVAAVVAPTVLEGSVSITPSPVATAASGVDPIVAMGSLSLLPAAAAAAAGVIDPTVVLGSIVVAPGAANAVATTIAPTVEGGGIIFTPDPALVAAVSVNPDVVLGSLILTPQFASAVATVLDPTVVAGGDLVIAPNSAFAVCTTFQPDIILSSVVITPAAGEVVTTVNNPAVLVGSPETSGSVIVTTQPAGSVAFAIIHAGTLTIDIQPRDS